MTFFSRVSSEILSVSLPLELFLSHFLSVSFFKFPAPAPLGALCRRHFNPRDLCFDCLYLLELFLSYVFTVNFSSEFCLKIRQKTHFLTIFSRVSSEILSVSTPEWLKTYYLIDRLELFLSYLFQVSFFKLSFSICLPFSICNWPI